MNTKKQKLTHREAHAKAHAHGSVATLNKLRASVLGANDGIVSVASVVAGVAGASSSQLFILTAGVAALSAGALSMAVGEYVSVSSQRDTQRALLESEKDEVENYPKEEFEELVENYKKKGLSGDTALQVARELTDIDAYAAHVDVELRIDPGDLNNPWHAAFASALAFLAGGAIPMLAVVLSGESTRLFAVFVAVIVALVVTGILSASVGGAKKFRAIPRVLIGGVLAMVITYGIGSLLGVGLS
ncbi:MAG TPA: VIT family protein [Candidatus Saccharibacteria bacterium]|nr:VIT family protein [Candidatus Saccharibacteria bacterium]HRQ07302.1 VIT family protein [Candidatus Saccharibacteria bacterium]